MGFEVLGTKFRIPSNYSFVKTLGKGAYGIVVCARDDARCGEKVAIKKICPMSKTIYSAKHTLREIRLLHHCAKHPNIITLKSVMVSRAYDELYIFMECMDTDLHRIIQSSQELSVSHFRHLMFQLLQGLHFLHKNDVLHRDLKPANLLVSKNCDLKISDFGLARRVPEQDKQNFLMTEHVVTRWYRPPELMLSPDGKYTGAVDMWSVGCILAELLGRKPLFQGKNFIHQLQLIFDVIGTPSSDEIQFIKNSQALQFLRSLKRKRPMKFLLLFPTAPKDILDFMEKCLTFDAIKRISVHDAIKHPMFRNYKISEEFDVVLDKSSFSFEFEEQNLDPSQLRTIILQEVENIRRENQAELCGSVLLKKEDSNCISTQPRTRNSEKSQRSNCVTGKPSKSRQKRCIHPYEERPLEAMMKMFRSSKIVSTENYTKIHGSNGIQKQSHLRKQNESTMECKGLHECSANALVYDEIRMQHPHEANDVHRRKNKDQLSKGIQRYSHRLMNTLDLRTKPELCEDEVDETFDTPESNLNTDSAIPGTRFSSCSSSASSISSASS